MELEVANGKQPKTSLGSKILNFIKNKPILFGLIIAGIVAITALAIILPNVLSKKNEEIKPINNKIEIFNNLPKYDDVIPINNEKIFDFSDIRTIADTKYANINSKSQEPEITYSSFCTYLGELSYNNEKEMVYLAYKWVIDNIAYDYDNYIHNTNQNIVYDPPSVFERKTTVCSGYSRLLRMLLICMRYESSKIKNIQGHSKGASYNPENVISDDDTNHEWNAVQIGDKWCLIDSTWGAGYINSDGFQKRNTEYYLCTPAGEFARRHLPQEKYKDLQFLEEPIDLNTFLKIANTNNHFFEYGFLGVAYDEQIQNICGRGRIVLKFDETKSPKILYHLKDEVEQIDDYITSKKVYNNYYYIDFYINKKGKYQINLFGKTDPSETLYYSFLSLLIKCDSSPNEKYSFPSFTDYYKDNIELISPMYKTLESNKKYNFKILASELNELYLKMITSMDTTSYETISMDKDGDYFIKNNVVIYKGFLYICYKESNTGNFYTLLNYYISTN